MGHFGSVVYDREKINIHRNLLILNSNLHIETKSDSRTKTVKSRINVSNDGKLEAEALDLSY